MHEWIGCAQCTIKALLDVYKIDNNDFFKALSGFAAGGAKEGDGMCGAYLAGVFFLGFEFGRNIYDIGVDPDDPRGSKKNRVLNPLIKDLHEKFIKEYGSITYHILGNPFSKIYFKLGYDKRPVPHPILPSLGRVHGGQV